MKYFAIDNCGEWLDIEVTVDEITGIFDQAGNQYPAAFDENYHVVATDTDSDGRVIGTDSQVIYGLEVG